MGNPRRASEATTPAPRQVVEKLFQERVSIEGDVISGWEEHARAHGRTKGRHGGLILRFFFTLMKKLKPRDRERLYYYVFHPEDVTAEDIAAILRVLESKG